MSTDRDVFYKISCKCHFGVLKSVKGSFLLLSRVQFYVSELEDNTLAIRSDYVNMQ